MSKRATVRNAAALATVFGVGFAPKAPGTAGSLVALPVAWIIAEFFGRGWVMLAAMIALAAGTWACEIYARGKGEVDPKECVIDEVVGQWIVCAFVPMDSIGLSIIGYTIAFLLFRLFDITKIWPIHIVEQRVPGGLGIMADDVVAALMASFLVAIIAHIGLI